MQTAHNISRHHYLLCYLSPLCLLWVIYYSFSIYVINSDKNPKFGITVGSQINSALKCHYLKEGDVLPSAEDQRYLPEDKAIFFHETSCRGDINSRQACAVESAARLHPNWEINLLFSSPVTKVALRKNNLAKLLKFQNVKVARIHIEKYGKGTLAEQILLEQLKKSWHPIEHAADILRIVTLNKFGGVSLDTDSMVIQNLEPLFRKSNFIAKQSFNDLATGIMAFTKFGVGANVTGAILKEFSDKYTPDSWSHNGPKAIQRVLKRICPGVVKRGGDCAGIKIFRPSLFYPIKYEDRHLYYTNGSIDNMVGPYMHHMWNHFTKDRVIEANSPYAKLARIFCPIIYHMHGDRFGN